MEFKKIPSNLILFKKSIGNLFFAFICMIFISSNYSLRSPLHL
jgi:hypothetical protein